MTRTTSDRREALNGFGTPSSTSNNVASTSSPDDLDQYALDRIDFRTRELTLCFNLSQEEQDDLRHDMAAEVLQALRRFDQDLASRRTFINRVLDRFVLHTKRARCTRMRRPWEAPVGLDDVYIGFEPVVNDPPAGERDEQDLRELRLDIQQVMARMPEKLQKIAIVLMTCSGREAAEELGIGTSSLYRAIERIRQHFIEAGYSGTPDDGGTLSGQLQM